MSAPVIALSGVRYSHDGTNWVLDGVDLEVRRGEWLALAGANGSGKSTLARVMAGLAAPDDGTVDLLGTRVFDDAHGADADAYRSVTRAIGMVFQNPEDQIVTTVSADDVAFGPENLAMPPAAISGHVHDALNAVDMAGWGASNPTLLSGGQQQRIAIAGMLAMDSQVLILDEPTAMLDPKARADVLHAIETIHARGTTIVMVTHHADEWRHADRIVRLEHGRIIDGAPRPEPAPPTGPAHHERPRPAAPRPAGIPAAGDAMADEPMVRFEDVSFGYGRHAAPVIEGLSCTVRRGRTLAVTGPNGSGKTTFARLLTGLARPRQGRVTVDGIDVGHATRRQRRTLRGTVGFVMQRPERQLFAATVAEDVAFGPRNLGCDEQETQRRTRVALETVGLGSMADRDPFTLSGGQQRLAAIAGVLACEPRLLVLDEPTASLDEDGTARIRELLHELHRRGATVVVITHDLHLARECADDMLSLAARTDRSAAAVSTADARFSPLAALDPRAKMGGVLVFMFAMFAMSTWPQLAVGALVTVLLAAASRLGVGRLWRSVRAFVALFACTGLLNLAVVHEGRVLCTIVHWQVTSGAVDAALLYAVRFSLVIVCGALVLETTTPTAITDAFTSLLSPLRRILHVQEIALVLSLALRFVPTLTGEAMAVRDAQAARGGAIETGSPAQRLRAACAIIVPVVAGAIRHAHNLALALDARSWQEGMPRTRWHALHMRAPDWCFLGGILLAIGLVIAGHVFTI